MFYLHYFSIGALYQPSLSTVTVLGQAPHCIEILHLNKSATCPFMENDQRSVLKHLLKNQSSNEFSNEPSLQCTVQQPNPKAPKFVGSPLQSPYFGTSPYHVRGPEKRDTCKMGRRLSSTEIYHFLETFNVQ